MLKHILPQNIHRFIEPLNNTIFEKYIRIVISISLLCIPYISLGAKQRVRINQNLIKHKPSGDFFEFIQNLFIWRSNRSRCNRSACAICESVTWRVWFDMAHHMMWSNQKNNVKNMMEFISVRYYRSMMNSHYA